jgi:hypothetical protein
MKQLFQLLIGVVTAGATILAGHEPVHSRHHTHLRASGRFQIDRITSSDTSDGTLQYGGKAYRVSIRMSGMSLPDMGERFAAGHVYHLSHLAHFTGAYGALRQNIDRHGYGSGTLWLENGNGVMIALQGRHGHATPRHVRSVNIAFSH